MKPNTTPSAEYLKNTVLTATPEQLHLMLYDGAIRFAERGLDALRAGDREGTFNALERAQMIVLELGNGLRREIYPELADRMAAVYNFIYRRLVDANLQRDEKAIDEALRVLRYQRETWLLLIDKLQKEARAAAPPASSDQRPSPSEGVPTFSVQA
jgi:flagellar secretion chaperone FliS